VSRESFWRTLEESLQYRLGGFAYKKHVNGLGLMGGEKVLDFGCGGGACARQILKQLSADGTLTCLDNSEFWLSKAKRRLSKHANIEFKLGDISRMDIPPSSYDVISIHFVLHDVDSSSRQETANVLARLLKDTGSLFIREPMGKHHGMPAKEIRSLMASAGLREAGHEISKSRLGVSTYSGIFRKKAPPLEDTS
jgi:ubiquinone/menaquinone biosynthesis C-methylase UbiE